jgi:pimeloyl-ACP methyl ester carboxylesterase
VSDATRLALLRAHVEQLRMSEGRLGVPESERSFTLLHERIAPGVLLLPGEGQGCHDLEALGRRLHRAGFGVLASSLAYRQLGRPGTSPTYWQTCLDEAENRFDMLNHFASRIAVVGAGLGAAMALHIARRRRTSAVVGLFPVLDAKLGMHERLQTALQALLPRRRRRPASWSMQRRLATQSIHKTAEPPRVPVLVIAAERDAGSDAARSLRAVHRLAQRGAAEVVVVPSGTASPADLPESAVESLLGFLKKP